MDSHVAVIGADQLHTIDTLPTYGESAMQHLHYQQVKSFPIGRLMTVYYGLGSRRYNLVTSPTHHCTTSRTYAVYCRRFVLAGAYWTLRRVGSSAESVRSSGDTIFSYWWTDASSESAQRPNKPRQIVELTTCSISRDDSRFGGRNCTTHSRRVAFIFGSSADIVRTRSNRESLASVDKKFPRLISTDSRGGRTAMISAYHCRQKLIATWSRKGAKGSPSIFWVVSTSRARTRWRWKWILSRNKPAESDLCFPLRIAAL